MEWSWALEDCDVLHETIVGAPQHNRPEGVVCPSQDEVCPTAIDRHPGYRGVGPRGQRAEYRANPWSVLGRGEKASNPARIPAGMLEELTQQIPALSGRIGPHSGAIV